MMKIKLVLYSVLSFSLMTCIGQNVPVKNASPVFTSKEVTRVSVGTVYTYSFAAMDSTNDPITYAVPVLPSWMTYSSNTHTLSGRPPKAGQFPVVISASDGASVTRQQFMLTVFDKHTVNILPLGNSITNGTDKYSSYRRPLWKLLHNANYNFDFIGSWSKHHMGGEVPDPDFDMDHEGHSGWNCDHIFRPPDWDAHRGNITEWLKVYTPDIVLVELGTNDVFQCRSAEEVTKNLNELATVLRVKNAHVKILIASVLPLGPEWSTKALCGDDKTYDKRLTEMNVAITNFVRDHTTKQSPVILVDQFSGINPAEDMFDDIHPNSKGEEKMAQKWFAALTGYLTVLKK